MALPGVKTTILDRFYNLGRTDIPSGPTLAIIAKRSNASSTTYPDLTPYFATGEKDVIDAYGLNSNLHRAYYEASISGAGTVVLVPLPANTTFNHGAGSISSSGFSGNLFDAAFDAVQSVRADIVLPWGAGSALTTWDDHATPATPAQPVDDFFYADNSVGAGASWVAQVANKCAAITLDSHPIFGVIGTRGFTGTEFPTPQQVATGLNFSTLISKESVPNGHFINVVAGEFRPVSYPSSWGWASAATAYAVTCLRLEPWRAPTGKPVYNIDLNRYNPTRSQSESLANKGVVVAAQNSRNVMQWVDATTFAVTNSDFARLTTLRICFDAVKVVLQVGENYIGEAMSTAKQNSFATEISSRLTAMTRVGALNNSDFRVQYDGAANKALVDLALWPAFELREIVLTVSVNF